MLRIDILSLFPEYFRGPFDHSMIKRAQDKEIVEIHQVDIRSFAESKHRQVDDRPYGGGPGMVMMPGPVERAIQSVRQPNSLVVYLSPQGEPLTAKLCRELAQQQHLVLLCGHYEGIDQRVLDREVHREISIGDYVLTNGCLPAIVLVDAVVRMIPGALGHEAASTEESFESGLLDWPHFTRPEVFKAESVPQELLRGDHKAIAQWRYQAALEKTQRVRPDLYMRHLLAAQVETEKTEKSEKEIDALPKRSLLAEVGLDSVRLNVQSLKSSLEFYRGRLGLRLVQKGLGYVVLDLGNLRLYLIEGQRPDPQGLGTLFEVAVADQHLFDRLAKRALEAGGMNYQGRQEKLPLREQVTLELRDPDGNFWCLRYRELNK